MNSEENILEENDSSVLNSEDYNFSDDYNSDDYEVENPVVEALNILFSLSDKDLDAVGRSISNYSFDFSSYDKLTKSLEIKLPGNEATALLLFLKYLQKSINFEQMNQEEIKNRLIELLQYHDIEEEVAEKAAPELEEKSRLIFHNLSQKVNWYENSIIDNLLDINGFVDIRPVIFKGKVSKFIPIYVFRIALRKDIENPRIFVFQVTQSEFDEKILGVFDKLKEDSSNIESIVGNLNKDLSANGISENDIIKEVNL